MTTESGALCVIPARGSSQRFPRKNLSLLAGRTLVARAVEVARASGVFRGICVSSDDKEVLDVGRRSGADYVLSRDPQTARYEAQVKDVCRAVLDELSRTEQPFAELCVLLPTSPLRTADDIRSAQRILRESRADCCMSVVRFEHPPQRALAITDGHVHSHFGDQYLKPAQALEPLYRHDGTVIFMRTEAFVRDGRFYGRHVAPYFVPRERAVDVDDPLDLAWAEFLVRSGVVSLEQSSR